MIIALLGKEKGKNKKTAESLKLMVQKLLLLIF